MQTNPLLTDALFYGIYLLPPICFPSRIPGGDLFRIFYFSFILDSGSAVRFLLLDSGSVPELFSILDSGTLRNSYGEFNLVFPW